MSPEPPGWGAPPSPRPSHAEKPIRQHSSVQVGIVGYGGQCSHTCRGICAQPGQRGWLGPGVQLPPPSLHRPLEASLQDGLEGEWSPPSQHHPGKGFQGGAGSRVPTEWGV